MENVVILVVLAVIAVPVGLLLAIVRHRSRLEGLEHRNQDLQADVVVLRRRVEMLETRRSAEAFSPVASPSSESTVGAFEASFVPSMDDFNRLDPRFRISQEVWKQCPEPMDDLPLRSRELPKKVKL